MKQRIVSLCLMLALCLGLLPVTAGAAAPAGQELYVGGVRISATGYWATDNAGNVTPAGDTPSADDYIHYDAETNTLTLHNAWIKNDLPYSSDIPASSYLLGSAIGVLNLNGDAALTIRLEGDNVIGDVGTGIYLLSTSGGNAGLTITGGGILAVSGSYNGILVQSNTGDAGLTIQEGARVAAATIYGWGVTVQSAADKDADLTVDGASLAAAGADSYGTGIYFYGPDTPRLTVNNSAMVSASRIAAGDMLDTPVSTGGTGGLVFEGRDGTVYGTMKLPSNLTIGEGQSLTLAGGANLEPNDHYLIVDGGTVSEEIKKNLGEKLKITPSITTGENLPDGTVGVPYNQTLAADGTEPITWSVTSGTLPGGLTLDASTGVISGTPTAAGTITFTVMAAHSWGEGNDYDMIGDTKELTITIEKAPDISVTGVTLDPATLTLTEGKTDTLTATITPDNATNKAVTWSSEPGNIVEITPDPTDSSKATITAKAEGTTTITATAADGSGVSATCEVTVTAASVPVASVTLNKTNLTLQEKASETLTATVVPDNATNKNVTWSSDNAAVATVDTSGKVTAVGAGTATITVTTEDGGETATCKVTVTHGTLTKTEAKAATCETDGNIEYWTCDKCGKYFSDAAGKTEITKDKTVIKATGHTLTKTEAKTATCETDGNIEYWTCGTCKKIFSDEAGTAEISQADTAIKATGHNYGDPDWTWAADGKSCTVTFTCKNDPSHTESPEVTVTSQVETAAGCTTTGTTAYTAAVNFDGTPYQSTTQLHDIPAAGHKLAKTAEKPATCTAAGKAAYYTCETCGRRFADEAAGTEITNLDEYGILPATGHTYVNGVCTACGTAAPTPAPTAAPTPSPTAAPAVPQTGDPAPISLWLVLALGSAAAVLVLIGLKVWLRRRQ